VHNHSQKNVLKTNKFYRKLNAGGLHDCKEVISLNYRNCAVYGNCAFAADKLNQHKAAPQCYKQTFLIDEKKAMARKLPRTYGAEASGTH
jgi:hypothetical protein